MSSQEMQDRLQDFLDGRLSERERREFESYLESDPELARRIQEYRQIGRALRGSREELPPGFYARARERFERQHAPLPRWRHWVSWEAVGLAAAGLLLAAIFLPDYMKDEPVSEVGGEDRLTSEGPAKLAEADAAAAPAESAADERSGAQARVDKSDAPADATTTYDEMAEADVPLERMSTETPPAAPAAPQGEAQVSDTRLEGKQQEAPGAFVEPPRPRVDVERRQAAVPSQARERTEPETLAVRSPVAPLPELVLRVFDDADDWADAGFAGDAVAGDRFADREAMPAPDFARQRAVVVESSAAVLDCQSLDWARVDRTIRLRIEVVQPGSGGRSMCTVYLPAGDEPVILAPPKPGR